MRIVILAAGQGSRLRPLTNEKPKCMVELNSKPLIQYQLDIFEKNNIKDINIIAGYLEDKINFQNVNKIINSKYDTTNMVTTLFCADKILDGTDDIIISYGDIVYNETVFKTLLNSNNDISVIVDKNWKKYWSARMENPLNDAETLKVDMYDNIIELGKKPSSYTEIEGQYIGLIKISKDVIVKVKNYYLNLDESCLYDGNDFNNMYMTSFLQLIADNLLPIKAEYIEGGWMEVDCPSDLNFSQFLK